VHVRHSALPFQAAIESGVVKLADIAAFRQRDQLLLLLLMVTLDGVIASGGTKGDPQGYTQCCDCVVRQQLMLSHFLRTFQKGVVDSGAANNKQTTAPKLISTGTRQLFCECANVLSRDERFLLVFPSECLK
jgi:hypothetical protein